MELSIIIIWTSPFPVQRISGFSAFAFLHIFHENSCRQNNADPDYRKNSKNWDTLNYYRDCPTNVIFGFYCAILRSKDADRITNRVDTDQTAP